MLSMLLSDSEISLEILRWIEYASMVIEILAVSFITFVVIYSTLRYLLSILRARGTVEERYIAFRHSLAKVLLLGLELLVAADIVRTVALEATFQSVGVLGLLVLVRILLGWSLTVEIEGKWPWQLSAERKTEKKMEEQDHVV